MILWLKILLNISFASDIDMSSVRLQYLQDANDYKLAVNTYIQEHTKYRNLKINEEYRQRITSLEKNLVNGNRAVLSTVNRYYKEHKDKVLLDDVLLMRLAQLEFDKANFEYNGAMLKSNSADLAPDYKKSLEYADRLLGVYPNSALADSAEYMKAYIYEEQADFDKAEKVYDLFLKKYPVSKYRDEVLWRLAELQFEKGQVKEARRNYLLLARKENSKFEFKALYKLGATLFETGLFEWSSKMFVRLYDRLKDDTISSAERSTLYDETLEYLGLLQRKGIAIKMSDEVEALSAKKIQSIFLRHGLWKESENVITDYIRKHPKSQYTPDMYARWVELYQMRNLPERAELVRSEYLAKFVDSREWWLANKDNYQARFTVEELVEEHLLSSARYLASIKKWGKASERFEAFLKQYPYDPKTIDVRIELAGIHYERKNYAAAYSVVKEKPAMHMTERQNEDYLFIRLSSFYAMNQSKKNKDVIKVLSGLALEYVAVIQNFDRAASIIRPVAEYLASSEDSGVAVSLLSQFPYAKIDYATKSVLDLLTSHIQIDRRLNKSQERLSLQQLKQTISLRKIFNLKNMASKAFRNSYDDLLYYVTSSDKEGFENALDASALKNLGDLDIYYLLKAQLLRSTRDYKASNASLEKVKQGKFKDYVALLKAKNLFDVVDFSNSRKELAVILSSAFKREYPEYYKVSYDLKLLMAGAPAANVEAYDLGLALNSEDPIVDHMFRLPVKARISFLNQAPKKLNGNLLSAMRSKKSCTGTVECVFSSWLKAKDNHANTNAVLKVLLPVEDTRWAFAIMQEAALTNVSLFNELDEGHQVRERLQKAQFKIPISSSFRVLDSLQKMQVPTKDVIIPWDIAAFEWFKWQGTPAFLAEIQLLLQEEKYKDLEEVLTYNQQSPGLESGFNMLKYGLLMASNEKIESALLSLKEFVSPDLYAAMTYMLGIEDVYNEVDSTLPIVIAANAKLKMQNNDPRSAIRILSSAIKENDSESIYYYGLLQAVMLLRDDMATAVIVKKAINNTDSMFARVVDSLLEGASTKVSLLPAVEKMLAYIIFNVKTEQQIAYLDDYSRLANAWLTQSAPADLKHDSTMPGFRFLAAAVEGDKKVNLKDPFFVRKLNSLQRDIASEDKK